MRESHKVKFPPNFAIDLELAEIEAWRDFCRAAPRDAIEICGIQIVNDSSTCFSIVPCVDTLAFNRVIGLGVTEPVTQDVLSKAISLYGNAGVARFFLQLTPDSLTADTKELLERNGFEHYNNWVKLWRDTADLPPVGTTLTVEEISSEDATVFSSILINSFGWSEFLQAWAEKSVGRRGWRHYMAYDGATPVATGAFFKWGEYAWIDFASTLPQARGRGAQAALLTRRVVDARRAGCKWLVVETAEDMPGKPAPSYRNMIRYGFQQAYVRPNYIYYCDDKARKESSSAQ